MMEGKIFENIRHKFLVKVTRDEGGIVHWEVLNDPSKVRHGGSRKDLFLKTYEERIDTHARETTI